MAKSRSFSIVQFIQSLIKYVFGSDNDPAPVEAPLPTVNTPIPVPRITPSRPNAHYQCLTTNNYQFPKWHEEPGDDITKYETMDLLNNSKFTPEERRNEYRRRGKSPSGVIDGVYNDTYCDEEPYNDANRDWDADA